MTTEIKFRATIGKTTIAPASGEAGQYSYKPGSFDVTFRVTMPAVATSKPVAETWFGNERVDLRLEPGPPPERAKGQHADAFAKQVKQHEALVKVHRAYLQAVADRELELAAFAGALRGCAR